MRVLLVICLKLEFFKSVVKSQMNVMELSWNTCVEKCKAFPFIFHLCFWASSGNPSQ